MRVDFFDFLHSVQYFLKNISRTTICNGKYDFSLRNAMFSRRKKFRMKNKKTQLTGHFKEEEPNYSTKII